MKAISDPTTKTVTRDVYDILTEAVVVMREEVLFRHGSTKMFELSGSIEEMLNYWSETGGMTDHFEEVIESTKGDICL